MKKVLLLTTLVALLVSFVAVPIASGHEGIGQGHTDYQGRGLGHEKHGDGTCTCVPPCVPPVPPCVPPCDDCYLIVGEDSVYETDIWWILEGWDYPELWWELFPEN